MCLRQFQVIGLFFQASFLEVELLKRFLVHERSPISSSNFVSRLSLSCSVTMSV
jgi:hypothetical protein